MNSGSFVYLVEINAAPQQTWEALMQPEQVAQYCPGMKLITDWAVGSDISLIESDGAAVFEGKVLNASAPDVLSYTYNAAPAKGKPVEPSRVTITLQPAGATATRLSLTHDQFVPYTKLRDTVSKVWPSTLSNLKSFLERRK